MMQQTDHEQPWVPESLLRRLRVGARVLVRLSGECNTKPYPGSVCDKLGCGSHHEQEDGMIGHIRLIGMPKSPEDHPYSVHYEDRELYLEDHGRACCNSYAAIELIPLDEAAR